MITKPTDERHAWSVWGAVACLSLGTLHSLYVLSQRRTVVDLELVWCSGLITAITTGLGVVPFMFTTNFDQRYVAIANAMAAGMMLSASCGLLEEGAQGRPDSNLLRCVAGFLVGSGFMWFTKQRMDASGDSMHVLDLDSMNTKRVLLVMSVMTLHSLSEGVGVGVSYHSKSLGSFITATLAVHNIPEVCLFVCCFVVRACCGVTRINKNTGRGNCNSHAPAWSSADRLRIVVHLL